MGRSKELIENYELCIENFKPNKFLDKKIIVYKNIFLFDGKPSKPSFAFKSEKGKDWKSSKVLIKVANGWNIKGDKLWPIKGQFNNPDNPDRINAMDLNHAIKAGFVKII